MAIRQVILSLGLLLVSAGVEALEIQGTWEQGALLVGRVDPGVRVEFMNREVRVDSKGRFVFGLGRSAPARVTLSLIDKFGSRREIGYNVTARQYDVQRVDGVPQSTVMPPEEVLERIRREAVLVKRVRDRDDDRSDFLAGFIKPVEGPITGVYGSQRIYNGEPRSPHYGLDIAAPTGTVVKSPAPGIVRLVQRELYYSGGTLIIDHGHGVSSTFLHLSDILVAEGDPVLAGDSVARVGATGRASGPHLDWRMNWFDVRVDPALVLKNFPARREADLLNPQHGDLSLK